MKNTNETLEARTAREEGLHAVARKKAFVKPEAQQYELPAITYGSGGNIAPFWVGPAEIN
jgi:hypothetical protein